MPRINNLKTDADIKDNDFVIGYDGDSGNAAGKYRLDNLKTYFDDSALEGFRTGRVITVVDEDRLESHIRIPYKKIVVSDGTAADEDEAIVASSSTALEVGSVITSVVDSLDISENDLLVIENESSGIRDFAVVDFWTESDSRITLKSNIAETDDVPEQVLALEDYTNFTTSKGFQNKVTIYRSSEMITEIDFRVEGDMIVVGDIKDADDNLIIQANPVTLSGDNTFTGENTFNDNAVLFEEGIRIDDSETLGYRFLPVDPAPENDQILAVDTSDDNTMKFKSVGELLPFGTAADTIAEWAEGNNTDRIPSSKVPIATDSVLGGVIAGNNITIGNNGTISATADTGTLDFTVGGTEHNNITRFILTGTALGTPSESGDELTLNINAGDPDFNDDTAGSVQTWAEGGNTDNIPNSKLPTATSSILGLASFDSNDFDVSSGAVSLDSDVAKLNATNEWTGENTFSATSDGGTINLKRTDVTPQSNDSLGFINHEAYSLETESYQDFARIESKYISDSDYEYGRYIIQTNYVTKSNDTYSTLDAITIDRDGATFDVDATFNHDVTIGSDDNDDLTVNATTEFIQPVTGAITEVVNDRVSSESYKMWFGLENDAPHIVEECTNASSITASTTSVVFNSSDFTSTNYSSGDTVYITHLEDDATAFNVQGTISSVSSGTSITVTITANSLGTASASEDWNVGKRDPFTVYTIFDAE